MILKKESGLTLVEISIVILLFSIILAAILTALVAARTSWNSGGSQLTVQQEVRKGISSMVRELRQARLSTITGVPADGASYNSIAFQIPETISETGTTWSTNIQYSLGGLDNAQLIRAQDTNQRILANNISALSFSRNAVKPETINITVTAQKNTFPGFSIIKSNITFNSELTIRNE
jgi:competence protein ComGC